MVTLVKVSPDATTGAVGSTCISMVGAGVAGVVGSSVGSSVALLQNLGLDASRKYLTSSTLKQFPAGLRHSSDWQACPHQVCPADSHVVDVEYVETQRHLVVPFALI